MDTEVASRYRSRILREMNANRENPFNSPPSSTGSHGTVSPTLSSVLSAPEGESTRRLNEDIARVTGGRKLSVNLEAAHRKWPEFYGMPKKQNVPIYVEDTAETRPQSAESKENRPPFSKDATYAKNWVEDSTNDAWKGLKRTRSEMQARVDNESDMSSMLSKSPGRAFSQRAPPKAMRKPSQLAQVHNRVPTNMTAPETDGMAPSIAEAIERLRRASLSPRVDQREPKHDGLNMSSAKSSLTAVPSSPRSATSPDRNATVSRSFFMPDISHLGDFVTGTLRFSGSNKNGVPIFVKQGRVHDRGAQKGRTSHDDVDGLKVPEDEEKIFVSMDMIRQEIVSLQDHYDKMQNYADGLQNQVQKLEAQLRSQTDFQRGNNGPQGRATEQLLSENDRLETEVATLKAKLEHKSHKLSLSEIHADSLAQERDRAIKKLQEACDDISKLTRKLSVKDRELENTDQIRQDNDTLRRDLLSLKHGRDSLESEVETLRKENEELQQECSRLRQEVQSLRANGGSGRRQQDSLLAENRSLRTQNKALAEDNDDLRDNLDGAHNELDASREEVETLRQENASLGQERSTLREDNSSLVRHNDKYFTENKMLRRENTGFERSVHDLQQSNMKLKEEVKFLKGQLDHCRPIPKEKLSTAPAEEEAEETEENMTSAFFLPDITVNTEESKPLEATETKDMPPPPELTLQSQRLPTVIEVTEQSSHGVARPIDFTLKGNKLKDNAAAKRSRRASGTKDAAPAQRVAFSVPEVSVPSHKASAHAANKGSKRRSMPQSSIEKMSRQEHLTTDTFDTHDESTGYQSMELTDHSGAPIIAERHVRSAQRVSSSSQPHRRFSLGDISGEIVGSVEKNACPVLSPDARRVLNDLCAHNCRNCTVCSRISSHGGNLISAADVASGKKRVVVSRPVPVTDRAIASGDLTHEITARPARPPGHALALVIKGLEDEARHMELELSKRQADYNVADKALGRRDWSGMAAAIQQLMRQLQAKNDQIYALYDVLEGQKASGQAMSEEEIEITVLNITGMTVRDVTSGYTEQLTWDGIQEV